MNRVELVISEAGRRSLAAAGVTADWIAAWLRSVGVAHVEFASLESGRWKSGDVARFFLAEEAELVRVALHHGKRVSVGRGGARGLRGVEELALSNPERTAWHYRRDGRLVLLMPPGDVAYQRHRYLPLFGDGEQPFTPLAVRPDGAGELPLEPGLSATLLTSAAGEAPDAINDGGYLPEEQLFMALRRVGLSLRTAESCTAGAVAARLARLPGSSEVLDAALVCYSNDAKQSLLGVPEALIERHGAVSREVVEAMAEGGGDAECACIAVSGIAGPGGGTPGKPVGTVWIATSLPGGAVEARRHQLAGARAEIQARTVIHAMVQLLERL